MTLHGCIQRFGPLPSFSLCPLLKRLAHHFVFSLQYLCTSKVMYDVPYSHHVKEAVIFFFIKSCFWIITFQRESNAVWCLACKKCIMKLFLFSVVVWLKKSPERWVGHNCLYAVILLQLVCCRGNIFLWNSTHHLCSFYWCAAVFCQHRFAFSQQTNLRSLQRIVQHVDNSYRSCWYFFKPCKWPHLVILLLQTLGRLLHTGDSFPRCFVGACLLFLFALFHEVVKTFVEDLHLESK